MSLNALGLGFTFTAKDLASASIQKLNGNFQGLDKASDQAGKAMAKNVGAVARGVERAGQVTAILGASLGAVLGLATVKAAEFSKAIALVATEADLSVFPQKQMEEVALRLAQTFGRAPVEQASALYKAVALGANDATKAQNLLTGANLLAVAGNADLTQVMNALGGALNAYGANMNQATDFSDALFVAMKNGNTTIEELAGSIGRITSTAAALKVPFDQVLAAVSVMTNKGVQATEAVSGLKAALANVTHPSADAAAEAARLGIKFDAAALRGMGLQKFLAQITGSSKFTADSLNKLFTSVEGANAVIQLTSGNMSSFNATLGEMGKRAGATSKGFELMTQTLDFQKNKLNSLKDTALIQIGKTLEPLAAKLLGFANMLIDAFTRIPKPLQEWIIKGAAVAAVVLTVVGAIGALVGVLLTSEVPIMVIVGALGFFTSALLPAVIGGGALVAVIYALKKAWDQNLGGMKDTIVGLYDKVSLVVRGLGQLFSDGAFSGAVMEELNRIGNGGLKNFIITVYVWANRIKAFFSGAVDGFDAALAKAGPIFERLSAAFQRLGKAFGFLGGENDPASNAKKFDQFTAAGMRVGEVFEGIVNGVVTAITWVTNFVATIVEGVGKAWPTFQRIGDAVMRVVVQLDQLFSAYQRVRGGSEDTGGAIQHLANWLSISVQYFAMALEGAVALVEFGLRPIVFTVDLVSRAFVALRDGVKAAFHEMIRSVIDAVLQLAKIVDKAGELVGKKFGATAAVAGLAAKLGTAGGPTTSAAKTAGAAAPSSPTAGPGAPVATGASVAASVPVRLPAASPPPSATPSAAGAQVAVQGAAQAAGAGAAADHGLQEKIAAVATGVQKLASAPSPFVILLDGEKLAEGIAARHQAGGARSFAAQPPPR